MQSEQKSENNKNKFEFISKVKELQTTKQMFELSQSLKNARQRIEALVRNAQDRAVLLKNNQEKLEQQKVAESLSKVENQNVSTKNSQTIDSTTQAKTSVEAMEVEVPQEQKRTDVGAKPSYEKKYDTKNDKEQRFVQERRYQEGQNGGFEKRVFGNREQNGGRRFGEGGSYQRPYNRDGGQFARNGQFAKDGKFQNRNGQPFRNGTGRPFQPGQKPPFMSKPKKVVFADTSILDTNTKNKFASSNAKKKVERTKHDESSKRKVMTVNGMSELDQENDEYFSVKKQKQRKVRGESNPQFIKIDSAVITTEKVSVKTLSEKIGQTVASIIKKLMLIGTMATINTDIDFPTAELVADEFGVKLEHKVELSADQKLLQQIKMEDEEGNTARRAPIVTVMGHVDHGKTSLLDAIRNSHVATGEAGGITQHIGAYTINYSGQNITFIDTPGHEAFTAMRARGASVTDVAILVVAADDGVMPQTKESIQQIKQAGVPMVVAINKIDKNDANPEKIKQQLAECDVMPEEWGGDTIMVNISARNNINIDKLLEMVLTVSEVADLKCNPERSAVGTVIEAKLDKGKGPVATVLVQNGTLHVGDTIISGLSVGRVRAMVDDKGKNLKEAGPSTPVSVLGLDRVPNAGDKMLVVDEQVAKQVVVDRKSRAQIEKQNTSIHLSAEDLLKKMQNKKPYNVVVKTDVQGSYEALVHMLSSIENDELQVVCVHGGVGAVNENDVEMAIASKAIIVAFNTKTESNAQNLAEQNGVEIGYYKVVYEVIDDVHKAIKDLLTPIYTEKVVGRCEVRVLFKISKVGTVAGCYVLDGKIPKNAKIKLLRDGEEIVKTDIVTLQKDKQDVKEVMQGYECGIKLDGFDKIKELDIFEASVMERVER